MRAASQNRLDYSELNHQDPLWVTKEILILDELEREAWKEYEDAARNMTLSMLSAQISEENEGSIRTYLDSQLNHIGKRLIPWAKWAITTEEKKKARLEEVLAARERYEAAFGSITGARVQEAERKAKLYLLSVRLARRAKQENRRFTQKQASWIADIRVAQAGDRAAWSRLSSMKGRDVLKLFDKTFPRSMLQEFIHDELGEDI